MSDNHPKVISRKIRTALGNANYYCRSKPGPRDQNAYLINLAKNRTTDVGIPARSLAEGASIFECIQRIYGNCFAHNFAPSAGKNKPEARLSGLTDKVPPMYLLAHAGPQGMVSHPRSSAGMIRVNQAPTIQCKKKNLSFNPLRAGSIETSELIDLIQEYNAFEITDTSARELGDQLKILSNIKKIIDKMNAQNVLQSDYLQFFAGAVGSEMQYVSEQFIFNMEELNKFLEDPLNNLSERQSRLWSAQAYIAQYIDCGLNDVRFNPLRDKLEGYRTILNESIIEYNPEDNNFRSRFSEYTDQNPFNPESSPVPCSEMQDSSESIDKFCQAFEGKMGNYDPKGEDDNKESKHVHADEEALNCMNDDSIEFDIPFDGSFSSEDMKVQKAQPFLDYKKALGFKMPSNSNGGYMAFNFPPNKILFHVDPSEEHDESLNSQYSLNMGAEYTSKSHEMVQEEEKKFELPDRQGQDQRNRDPSEEFINIDEKPNLRAEPIAFGPPSSQFSRINPFSKSHIVMAEQYSPILSVIGQSAVKYTQKFDINGLPPEANKFLIIYMRIKADIDEMKNESSAGDRVSMLLDIRKEIESALQQLEILPNEESKFGRQLTSEEANGALTLQKIINEELDKLTKK